MFYALLSPLVTHRAALETGVGASFAGSLGFDFDICYPRLALWDN
jgi:hypothetical protein